jgi:hypothetical protein
MQLQSLKTCSRTSSRISSTPRSSCCRRFPRWRRQHQTMNCERVRENHLDETLDHVQAVALISAQRASIPPPAGLWLNHAVCGHQEGRRGHHRPHPYLSAKSHPPLWQYFSRLRRYLTVRVCLVLGEAHPRCPGPVPVELDVGEFQCRVLGHVHHTPESGDPADLPRRGSVCRSESSACAAGCVKRCHADAPAWRPGGSPLRRALVFD